jgi:hypothetical protein
MTKWLTVMAAVFGLSVSSGIDGVKVDKVLRKDGGAMALLIRNETEDRIRVFEAKACAPDDCQTVYITGDFRTHAASWSDDFTPKGEPDSIVLTRVQSVEKAGDVQ